MNPKILLVISLLLVASSGCVRRRLTVRTTPPGASVYVDNQYIGTSPTATATTFYGTREIQVVREGYRTERILRRFNLPWYQLPPIDFISDTLWPKKIRDERIVDITLLPQQVMSSEELSARANNLRIQAAQGVATPLPPSVSLGTAALGSEGQLPAPIDPTFQTP
jgi:PEGA domain